MAGDAEAFVAGLCTEERAELRGLEAPERHARLRARGLRTVGQRVRVEQLLRRPAAPADDVGACLSPLHGMPVEEVAQFREFSSTTPPLDRGQLDRAARCLLRAERRAGGGSHLALDGAMARLRPRSAPADVHALLRPFGECADLSCGCCRLVLPHVRPRFRDCVAALVAERWAQHGSPAVRYVTIGSGQLLLDVEILLSLSLEHALTIETVVCIDTAYADAVRKRGVCTAADAGAGPIGDPQEAALARLALVLAPARVFAFDTLSQYELACAHRPDLFGRATTLVQARRLDPAPAARIPAVW